MKERIKKRSYFEKDAESFAKWLLGKTICVKQSNRIEKMTILEVEAYPSDDSACYGYDAYQKGIKPTNATKPLFEKPGTCCIYAGMLLISCTKLGAPDNVLIRKTGNSKKYCEGPLLTGQGLNINTSFNYEDIASSPKIWIENNCLLREYAELKRVNLSKKVKASDVDRLYRFISL